MKRIAVITIAILLLTVVVFAESGSWFYPELDWFSLESSEIAMVPDGLSEREIEIYRAGYANGHFDALNPAYEEGLYVINTKTKKFHLSNCMSTLTIEAAQRKHSYQTSAELIENGYKPCGQCHPERNAEQDGK